MQIFNSHLKATFQAQFVGTDPYRIVSRDFLHVKMWDARYPKSLLYQAPVTSYLEENLT
jgi:hypothetical protein